MEFIVGKNAGFCYGVNRAVEGCKKVLEENKGKSISFIGCYYILPKTIRFSVCFLFLSLRLQKYT